MAVIYASGQPDSTYAANAGGVNPVSIPLGSNAASLTFPTVTGTVSCNTSQSGYNGPDGGSCGNGTQTDVGPANSLSEIKGDTTLPLVGVFLGNGAPSGSTPAATDFTGHRDDTSYAPLLQQVFFIGDGQTSGRATQTFNVPAGATTLWLGLADSASVNQGTPGHYDDNGGSFTVTASIATGAGQELPDARYAVLLPLVALSIAGAAVTVRRRRRRS